MSEQMNLKSMTDRELRNYKRRLRRQKELRKKIATILFTVCLVAICAVSYHSIETSANEGQDISFKYYTRITVESGESMWDVAEKYMDYDHYEDKNAYIEEVIHINHLDEDAFVRAGQQITVPYYSDVFVK